jgi:hypothetical protein
MKAVLLVIALVGLSALAVVDAQNCTVTTYYTGYSGCTKTCGGGTQWLARSIVRQPGPGGNPCPPLNVTVPCNTQFCYG